ncbi:MAG: translation initiation factor eIF-1A [Candidatus Hodarchaeota archaeon]
MPKKKKSNRKKHGRSPGSYQAPEITRVRLPYRNNGEMFARVIDIYGQERMGVFCEDGKHRVGRIRGKIKKRVWIRKGDLIIVNPWEFETEIKGKMEKCEISWRYLKHEVSWIIRNNKLPQILKLDNIPV